MGAKPVQKIQELFWLGDVHEVRFPISEHRPIWIRNSVLRSGPPLPQPTVPHPERHPYCEFTLMLEGRGIQFVGTEQLERNAGDVMLLGPGMPHYGILHRYPHRAMTVYFLPTLLFGMGPQGDGARILSRFTSEQSIKDRIVLLPPTLKVFIKRGFKDLTEEFEHGGFGSEMRLRTILIEMLVKLMRWEETSGKRIGPVMAASNWSRVEKALHYLQEHYTEPLYVEQVAQTVGISVSRLQAMFREALGMSCVKYLQAYRISHAAALLNAPDCRVTEVAMNVGFETLSHFNTSFRHFMGMSPRDYIRSQSKTAGSLRKTG